MHRFVAAGRPAGSLGDKLGMIAPADEELPGGLLLKVAADAQILIALRQHLGVHASVRLMAGGASFADGFMLENKGTSLRNVAFPARFTFEGQGGAATVNGVGLVRIVAIRTSDLAFEDGMMRSEMELAAFVEVALEACLWTFPGVHDRVAGATALRVNAARPMTRFATNLGRVRALRLQERVRGGLEIARDVIVALAAALGADKFGSGNGRRDHHRPRESGAGNQADRGEQADQAENDLFGVALQPGEFGQRVHKKGLVLKRG